MTFGSKNRAMGVAGTRIITFNGLLFFFFLVWRAGESKARTRMGRKNKIQKRVVWSYPLWVPAPEPVRPEETLALPEHISGAASRTTGLVRKFEENKELNKRLQNLTQNLVQVCSSYGSLANIWVQQWIHIPSPVVISFPLRWSP